MFRRISFLALIIVGLCLALPAFAQETEQTPEPGTRADNECYAGGTMEGKCDRGFNPDGSVNADEIAWAWMCGWYMARFNDGDLSREEVNTACGNLLPPLPLIADETAPATFDCGVFFGGGYTICVLGNYIKQDSGNDGSFETAFRIVPGTNAGDDGICPPGTIYNGSLVDYQFSEPAFYAWIIGKGFGQHNDICIIL